MATGRLKSGRDDAAWRRAARPLLTVRAVRLGYEVKEGCAAHWYIEGPGNDGRGIFNRWYPDEITAATAANRHARRYVVGED